MSKKSKIKIDGILNLEKIPLHKHDASIICEDESLIEELEVILKETGLLPADRLKEFLIKNEKNIDIGKVVILTAVRCQQYIDAIKMEIGSNQYTKMHIAALKGNMKSLEKSIKDLKYYYKKMNEEYLSYIKYDKNNKDYNVRIYNSNEIIRNQDKSDNIERFNDIDRNIFKENDINNIFSILAIGDIPRIFPDKELGNIILISIESKIANKVGKIKFNRSTQTEDIQEAAQKTLEDNQKLPEIEDILNEELLKYTKYIDLDKFLLICAYRLREQLDTADNIDQSLYKKLLEGIEKSVDKKAKIFYISKYYDDKFKEEVVQYSSEELKTDLERFVDEEYWSYEKLNEEKRKILEGSANLDDYSTELIKIMNISKYEIEKAMELNLENFISGVRILNYNIEKIANSMANHSNLPIEETVVRLYKNGNISRQDIIFLYKNGVIDNEIFESISNEIDFSQEINLDEMKGKYFELKQTKGNSEKEDILVSEIELYKSIIFDKKTSEEQKKIADEMMYDIYDNENAIIYFFDKGLIPLEVVADWTGEDFVEKLYNKKSINLEKVETLYIKEKVSKKFLEKKILESDLTEEQMISYIRKKYISQENIIKIFEENAIYSAEADKLFEDGIILKQTYETIKNRDLSKLADNAGNPFEGGIKEIEEDEDIIEIPKENSTRSRIKREYDNDEYVDVEIYLPNTTSKSEIRGEKGKKGKGSTGGGKSKKLINPLVRDEFLRALKRKLPRDVNYDGMGEKNPFYNYNFFIIKANKDEKEIKRDDIIIAERFYVDRETRDEFATDNATYVMRYEDYLILQGKQKENEIKNKREAIKEVEGAIYVVNHRSGTWAKNLLKAITQAKFGKGLKSVLDRNTREKMIKWLSESYSDDEFLKIWDIATRMDRDEEFTYVKRNGKYVKINNLGTNADDTESR